MASSTDEVNGEISSGFEKKWDLLFGKKLFTVTATDEYLSWRISEQELKADKTSAKVKDDSLNRKLGYSDMIYINQQEDKQSFTIRFIDRKPKFIWRRSSLVFHSTKEQNCEEVVAYLKEQLSKVSQQRPKSVLVLVNPVSGRKNGGKIYKSIVEPVLQEAGIKIECIVSTHAGHIKEYMQENDVSKYEGIVVVGGDGTLTEAVNGLLFKQANQPGSDLKTNPETSVEPIKTRIGIIPAGSGQGMVKVSTNTVDAETATLHIIKVAKCLIKNRSVPLEVSYRLFKPTEKEDKQEDKEEEATEDLASGDTWITDKNSSFRAVSAFLFDLTESEYCDHMLLFMLDGDMTRMQHMKFLHAVMSNAISTADASEKKQLTTSDNVQTLKTRAVKIKLTGHTVESLKAISTTDTREVLNIDGEPFVITHPEIELRFHENVMPFLGSGHIDRAIYVEERRKAAQEKKAAKEKKA